MIMAKCSLCGKKGLFLKINSNGRCDECETKVQKALKYQAEEKERVREEKRKERLMTEAGQYFDRLVREIQSVEESVNLNRDVIERLNDIPALDEKCERCKRLADLIDQHVNYEGLGDVVQEHMVYKESFDERVHLAWVEGLSVYVYADRPEWLDELVKELKKNVSRRESVLADIKYEIRCNAAFQKELDSIPSYSIRVDDKSYPALKVGDLGGLKYSSITSRSNFDKLGTFIAIDTETTGLNAGRNAIIEVSAVYFENWKPCLRFETLIKPKKPIPQEATSINGITNDMVKDSPSFQQIITSLNEFIGKNNLVGHNLPFDLKFLYHGGLDLISQKRKYYDTLDIARKTLSTPHKTWDKDTGTYEWDGEPYDVENFKLDTLCDYYYIRDNVSAHRAYSDCLATGYLFRHLARRRTG